MKSNPTLRWVALNDKNANTIQGIRTLGPQRGTKGPIKIAGHSSPADAKRALKARVIIEEGLLRSPSEKARV